MFMVVHNIHGICVVWNIAPVGSEDTLSRVAFVLQEEGFHPLKREGKIRKNRRCAGEKENTWGK
jgi:hypothetical protein